jgi:hypothetical protein
LNQKPKPMKTKNFNPRHAISRHLELLTKLKPYCLSNALMSSAYRARKRGTRLCPRA